MGSFCNSNPSTTQSSAPNPLAMQAYSGILGRAQQVASTPYQAYGGQLTAGLDPTQQAGISNINAAYGMAQPYFNTAAGYAQQGAAPVANISGADIQRYQNPYQQAVIDATMGNINEADQRQQQQVKGNAAMAGALGGDRQAVAQAELARQQGLARNQTLAGLQSQGYTQALGAAQSQQANQQQNAQRAANAAYAYGQLGTGAQGAQLQGAGAQLGAGSVAQQTEQARLAAQYGQFQQQQAFPYQQTSWLAGIAAPIGSQMGQTNTTTPPTPSPLSQYGGLALSAASMFLADGGRIPEYAGGGGTPYDFINDVGGYVPRAPQIAAHPLQMPGQGQQQQAAPNPMAGLNSGLQGLSGAFSGSRLNDMTGGLTSNWGYNSGTMPGTFELNYGTPDQLFPGYSSGMTDASIGGFGFADGGLVDTVRAIRKGLRSYADGGDVDEMPFNDRWAPVAGGMPEPGVMQPTPVRTFDAGNWSPQEVGPQAMQDWRGSANLTGADPDPVSPAVQLPPEITAGMSRPPQGGGMPPEALPFDRSPMAPPMAPAAEPDRGGLLSALGFKGISPEMRQGMMAAGLGMMAAKSPYGLANIGEGGLKGMQAMGAYRKEELAKKASERLADTEARKLMHDLQKHDLEERKLQETIRQRKAPKLTTDERGFPVLIDPLTGQIVGRPDFNAQQPGGPPIHTPNTQEPPPAPPPNAPKAPVTPKPDQVAAKEEEGLPPNAQFVADTSGGVVAPWRNPTVLEGMRPADQELVRAIAEGRRQFLPLQRNNRYNQYIMEKVHEYDPQADQTAFARRQRMSNFFAVGTAGGGGQNIAAMNTFGQHAKELNDLADELNMGRFTDWNALKASLIQRGLGPKEAQDKIGKWQTAAKAVADEGAKVFAGSQSALADREAWHKLFDVSNPKSVTKAKLQEIVKLIDGRLNSLAAQYNDGMRTNHAPPEFIKPRTREIFDQIRGSKAPPGLEGGSATGAAGAKPDAATRFKQLIQGGASEDDAYKTLKKEGYGG